MGNIEVSQIFIILGTLLGCAFYSGVEIAFLTSNKLKIELDKKPGDPVDLFVNDKLVAKGEIVLIDDKVGLTLTEIIAND